MVISSKPTEVSVHDIINNKKNNINNKIIIIITAEMREM